MQNVLILGGGASGLTAAVSAARAGARVTLLERGERVGRKLLATGNGRCNLTNARLSPADYHGDVAFIREVLAAAPLREVLSFFSSLGLMTRTEEEGRVYPRSGQAAAVLDVLRRGLAGAGVDVRTGARAVSISPSRKGGFSVSLEDGSYLRAERVVCACGGKAAPHFGSDGAAYALLTPLGHTVTPLYPALTQLRCRHRALRSLKGIRAQAEATLLADSAAVSLEEGEVLFTDYGLSGYPIFQLSGLSARLIGAGRDVCVRLNLLPELPPEARALFLSARLDAFAQEPASALWTGVLHRRLGEAVLADADVAPDARCGALGEKERRALLHTLFGMAFPVTGVQGFDSAQVTAGGVPTDEVEPATLASRLIPGLYITGETLDVDGRCGGFNLHFAWATGLLAGRAAAQP